MRPQDSVALRHRSTQLIAIKGQLREKVYALKKELETKRKSNTSRPNDMDDGNSPRKNVESGKRDYVSTGGKL